MQHLRSLDNVRLTGAWVTIGSFDGVHLGHQAIIRRLVEGAHAAGLPAVVVTFFPHPAKVLRGNGSPFYLSTPEEQAELLAGLGVDVTITLTFNPELAALTARQFIQQLADALHLRRLLVGHDFALGHGREGTFEVLEALGLQFGYEIEAITPFLLDGELVSSSRIRELLSQTNVALAARLLGREYAVEGKVVPGDGRGRTIGIPTANLELWKERLLPGRGVYATRATFEGQEYPSVTNIGLRPTFENEAVLLRLETHLLDFQQDLYGKTIRLAFTEFLRTEQKFSSIQALIDQIQSDIQTARKVLLP